MILRERRRAPHHTTTVELIRRRDFHTLARTRWVNTQVAARRFDPRPRPLPHIVIVGAQRSGTTSLYEYLVAHPDVRAPVRKEVHFLSQGWDHGLPWYRRHFPVLRDPELRTLEATPDYLSDPKAPRRAAAVLPQSRFVALLREPSARAISHYFHNRVRGIEPLGIEEAFDAEAGRLAGDRSGEAFRKFGYVARGYYAEQVRRWQAAVGDRLLVTFSEDLFDQTELALRRILQFVGLTPTILEPFPEKRSNTASASLVPARLRNRLEAQFGPSNEELAAVLGRRLAW